MVNARQLEDAKRRDLSRRWSYVTRLCREAAEAARDENPAKIRRLLVRIEAHTAEAERLARTNCIVQGDVIQGHVLKQLAPA